jgi:hypothetical protein
MLTDSQDGSKLRTMNVNVVHLTNPGGPGFSEAAVDHLRARQDVTKVDAQNKDDGGRYADVLLYFRSSEDREEFVATAAATNRAAAARGD